MYVCTVHILISNVHIFAFSYRLFVVGQDILVDRPGLRVLWGYASCATSNTRMAEIVINTCHTLYLFAIFDVRHGIGGAIRVRDSWRPDILHSSAIVKKEW